MTTAEGLFEQRHVESGLRSVVDVGVSVQRAPRAWRLGPDVPGQVRLAGPDLIGQPYRLLNGRVADLALDEGQEVAVVRHRLVRSVQGAQAGHQVLVIPLADEWVGGQSARQASDRRVAFGGAAVRLGNFQPGTHGGGPQRVARLFRPVGEVVGQKITPVEFQRAVEVAQPFFSAVGCSRPLEFLLKLHVV